MKPTSKTPTKYPGVSKVIWPTGRVQYESRAPWWKDAEGKRHEPTKYCDTLKDARDFRDKIAGKRQRGTKTPTGRLTLGTYLDTWIERYEARSPGNTAARYKFGLAKLKGSTLWGTKLADIERDDIAAAYDRLKPGHVLDVHQPLHRALRDAVPKYLGVNPASGAMRGRKTARTERMVWTEDEYRQWLTTATRDALHALWRLLGQTGARRGEALGLDWTDVDFENGRISIRRQYTPLARVLVVKDLKTPRGRRTIDVDTETIAVLREWRKAQPKPIHPTDRDRHAVFTYPDGSRIGPTKALNERFRCVVARAGVRAITLHDVRHTHATLLLGRGVPIHVVSRRLGHAKESITLDLYTHVLPDMARMAADVAGAIASSFRPAEEGAQ